MWTIIESDIDIQVLPEGEESVHFWDGSCNCRPRVSLGRFDKLVITHNACDQRQILEMAYDTPLHTVRQQVDC
jgi:hypothetical protein